MRRLIISILLISTVSYAQDQKSLVVERWMKFPIHKIPALSSDEGLKTLLSKVKAKGRAATANESGNLVDFKNSYINISLGDDGYLEFIAWQGRSGQKAVVTNRYRGDEQKFALWTFDSKDAIKDSTHLLKIDAREINSAYTAITGRRPLVKPEIHWTFPRVGTTIVASLAPVDQTLLSKCRVLRSNEYDCGSSLDIAKFTWTGGTFKRTWFIAK